MPPRDVLTNGEIAIDVGTGLSRRDVLKQVGGAGAVLGTAGCLSDSRRDTPDESPTDTPPSTGSPVDDTVTGTPPGTPTHSPGSLTAPRHPAVAPPGWDPAKTEAGDGMNERRAVLVVQNIDNEFFMPIVCGFHDALHQFGWEGEVRGPGVDGTLPDQVNVIEGAIEDMEAGDVLLTTILDTDTYDEAIQTAFDNDIVVVNAHTTPRTQDWNYEIMREEIGFTYTSPVTGEDREMIVPHVGINEARGGAAMAAEAYERLQAKLPDQDEYTVFLVNDLPSNPQVTRRVDEQAAEEGTAQRYFEARDDVTIHRDEVATTPQPPEIEAARNFIVGTIAGEEIDAVVTSAFWSGVGAGRALDEGELEGPMVIGSFDVLDPLLDSIEAGHIDFTLGQDLYGQGYRSAEMAWIYLERGIPTKDLEWGVSVWDEDNVAFGLERRSWTELREWQRNNYEYLQ
jgi:ABC-type sugar transport system substrate-binding protein